MKHELGRFIIRDGPFLVGETPVEPKEYWTRMAVTSPRLAKIALRLLAIAPTEASVERAFSHRANIHSALRNALSDASVGLEFCSFFLDLNSTPFRPPSPDAIRSSVWFPKNGTKFEPPQIGAEFEVQALLFVRMNSVPLGISAL